MGALKYTDGFAGIFSGIVIVACFTAGAQFVTWMGNQIDAKGIGNGLSLMIFAGIVADWSRVALPSRICSPVHRLVLPVTTL